MLTSTAKINKWYIYKMLSTVLDQDRNNGNGYPLHRQLKSSSIFISASLSWKWLGKKVTCVPYTGQILAFLITKMLQTSSMWVGWFTLLLQKRRWNPNLLSFSIYCYMHRTPLNFSIYNFNFSSPPIKCTHMNWTQRNGLFWLLWQAGQHCCLKKLFSRHFLLQTASLLSQAITDIWNMNHHWFSSSGVTALPVLRTQGIYFGGPTWHIFTKWT